MYMCYLKELINVLELHLSILIKKPYYIRRNKLYHINGNGRFIQETSNKIQL